MAVCPVCLGGGRDDCGCHSSIPDSTCEKCGGSGTVQCEMCGGTGKVKKLAAEDFFQQNPDAKVVSRRIK